MQYDEQEMYASLKKPKSLNSVAYMEALQRRCAPNPKKPKHDKAAIVVEILNTVGTHKVYNFTYWLKQVGETPPNIILGWLKEISDAPAMYAKGAILTNKFKKRREAIKASSSTVSVEAAA